MLLPIQGPPLWTASANDLVSLGYVGLRVDHTGSRASGSTFKLVKGMSA